MVEPCKWKWYEIAGKSVTCDNIAGKLFDNFLSQHKNLWSNATGHPLKKKWEGLVIMIMMMIMMITMLMRMIDETFPPTHKSAWSKTHRHLLLLYPWCPRCQQIPPCTVRQGDKMRQVTQPGTFTLLNNLKFSCRSSLETLLWSLSHTSRYNKVSQSHSVKILYLSSPILHLSYQSDRPVWWAPCQV